MDEIIRSEGLTIWKDQFKNPCDARHVYLTAQKEDDQFKEKL